MKHTQTLCWPLLTHKVLRPSCLYVYQFGHPFSSSSLSHPSHHQLLLYCTHISPKCIFQKLVLPVSDLVRSLFACVCFSERYCTEFFYIFVLLCQNTLTYTLSIIIKMANELYVVCMAILCKLSSCSVTEKKETDLFGCYFFNTLLSRRHGTLFAGQRWMSICVNWHAWGKQKILSKSADNFVEKKTENRNVE